MSKLETESRTGRDAKIRRSGRFPSLFLLQTFKALGLLLHSNLIVPLMASPYCDRVKKGDYAKV